MQWPPRTYQDYCVFQQHALACLLQEPWLYDRLQLLLEESMSRRFMPTYSPPYQVFPFRGTHFGGDRTLSLVAGGGWTDVLSVQMPAGAHGVVRGVSNSVVESEAWGNVQWRITHGGATVPGFGGDPLDGNALWDQQWGNIDAPHKTNIIVGERQTVVFQAQNNHSTDDFHTICRWFGWHWPQLVGRQDGAHGHREP